ncbi:MAG: hypothetical protein WCJ35_07935 [Planctomycetota bacterium]
MYLNHELVTGFPLTLRYGEERDRDYLALIFTEVWGEIPEKNRLEILSRGYGHVAVDVLNVQDFKGHANKDGDIRLPRTMVDFYSRSRMVHVVAHELARLLDEFDHPDFFVEKKLCQNMERRIATILELWGHPAKATIGYTQADEARIRANRANFSTSPPGGDGR